MAIQAERKRRKETHSFSTWLKTVSPKMVWDWSHLLIIISKFEALWRGEIKKLMIFMPPRHGKSELATIRGAAWFLERNPSARVILGAYNQTLANKFSRRVRRIIEERVGLSAERTAVEDWETLADGGLRAVGVGAGITGQGGNHIIIDDPVKSREEANSRAYRNRVWDWYTDDLYTRLEPNGTMVLIMTRWHQDDLAGRIIASDDAPNWHIINLPAFAENNDLLGRAEGEPLCPERFDDVALKRIKEVLGSSFDALYQQRPSALEGSIFKRDWWKFYSISPRIHYVIQSWDTAFKTGEGNDFSVCTSWGITDSGFYLLDCWRERIEFPELKRTVNQLAEKYLPRVILVEDKASGQSLIQELQRDTRWPVLPIKIDADKEARAHVVTPLCEAGKIFLPETASWLIDFIDEMAAFPTASHDDIVDSTSQALNYLLTNGMSPSIITLGSDRSTSKMDW